MSGIFDLVKRYPWLPSFKKCFPEISDKNPSEFIEFIYSNDNYRVLNERTLEFFQGAFDKIEDFSFYMDDEINIYFYWLIRIVLSIFRINQITHRIAELYSKVTYSRLNKEINNDFNLDYIYKDLDLDIPYDKNPTIYKKIKVKGQNTNKETKFKVHFIDYLRLASSLKDDHRRLINNSMANGYVYLGPDIINRLIQEHVRKKISNLIDIDNVEKLFKIHEFKKLLDIIKEIWEEKKEEFEYTFKIAYKEGKELIEDCPPCVQEITLKAKEGQNLIHTERLFIVWFLNALKIPEEDIISVFSTLPDFDRDKTAYQVMYAIKKGYTPYSCQSLKSYNLCLAKKYKDKICLEGYYSRNQDKQLDISHPLAYVRIKQYRNFKKSQNSNNQHYTKNE